MTDAKTSQNIEIITVLCGGASVDETGLLAALQSNYPTTGWTAELLNSRLVQGRREGRYRLVNDTPYTTVGAGWQINPKMLSLNYPTNKVYANSCTSSIEFFSPLCNASHTAHS